MCQALSELGDTEVTDPVGIVALSLLEHPWVPVYVVVDGSCVSWFFCSSYLDC